MEGFFELRIEYQVVIVGLIMVILGFLRHWLFTRARKRRQEYYRNVYLKSDDWRRKRYVVLRRDNWRCVYCGNQATEVHHLKYAKYNIGREPIDWLVSICQSCHDSIHN